MNKKDRLKHLFEFYSKKELLNAFLIDLLFFVLLGGIAIIFFINIVFMVVRFFMPMYLALYAILVLVTFFAKKYFIETLKNYKDIPNLDYKQIKYWLVIVYSVIILAVQLLIFTLIS